MADPAQQPASGDDDLFEIELDDADSSPASAPASSGLSREEAQRLMQSMNTIFGGETPPE